MHYIHMYKESKAKQKGGNTMSFERTCKRCKKGFNTKRDWQKFCNPECQKLYWKEIFHEQAALNKRVEKLEKQVGIK